MKKKCTLALLLVLAMVMTCLAGCGSNAATSASASAEQSVSAPAEASKAPAAPEAASQPEADSTAEPDSAIDEGPADYTEANANNDYDGWREMLKTLHTELPITEDPVTLTYFLGYETSGLSYIEDSNLENQQVWKWLAENTGVSMELTVVDKTSETDKFNLMIASGDYTDLMNISDYAAGPEAALNEDIIIDLGEYLEDNMPNYSSIIHADQNVYSKVQDADMFLCIYPIKDQNANPGGIGTFVRMDWLEDLGMDVPTTYDELTDVLTAFKNEKGATEPMSLFNTVSMQNGLLMGGFGSKAELSADAMGTDFGASFYQEDGKVVYGATQDGTRKYLSWLHKLYEQGLINFENMQNRDVNPFGDLNAGEASRGETGYIFSNQPFGGNYSTMAAQNGDTNCNWWPVQDVAEVSGQTIPFYEETSMVDTTGAAKISISSQCDDVETALQFLDYGYSYEGGLLYNYGFEEGSGHDVETWYYDDNGEPMFDGDALLSVAESTNLASGVVSTKDLAGVVYDTRLSFEFGERELSCFDAWSTNKNGNNNLGSDVVLTSEESTEASAIYSDIITHVATSALQFINGAQDVDDDAVWNAYVKSIEDMNISGLTEIIQTAYDRVN